LVEKDYVEVGIGPMRILQQQIANQETEKAVRLVMRRESYVRGPGTKLLLNIRLSSCVSSEIINEKSILLTALEQQQQQQQEQEEEEEEIKPRTYLFRFGTPEEAHSMQQIILKYSRKAT
jgi:hypothetical protein